MFQLSEIPQRRVCRRCFRTRQDTRPLVWRREPASEFRRLLRTLTEVRILQLGDGGMEEAAVEMDLRQRGCQQGLACAGSALQQDRARTNQFAIEKQIDRCVRSSFCASGSAIRAVSKPGHREPVRLALHLAFARHNAFDDSLFFVFLKDVRPGHAMTFPPG
jgi:hypothetical protein